MKTQWKNKSLLTKTASITSIVIAVAVIVLSALQPFDAWSNVGYVYIPLMGINLLLQAYAQWKPNRDVAILPYAQQF